MSDINKLLTQFRETLTNTTKNGSYEAVKNLHEHITKNPADLKRLDLSEEKLKKIEEAREAHGFSLSQNS